MSRKRTKCDQSAPFTDIESENDDKIISKIKRSRKKVNTVYISTSSDDEDFENIESINKKVKSLNNNKSHKQTKKSQIVNKKKVVRKKKEPKAKVSYFTRTTNNLFKFHPYLIDTFIFLNNEEINSKTILKQPENLKTKLLPFQLEGLNWLISHESSRFNGGILADDMGMGKTIQMISLFVSDLSKKPNLVVAPTVALIQWNKEFDKHVKSINIKTCIYHGQKKKKSYEELLEQDVIFTSYATLESSYRKQVSGFKRKLKVIKEDSPLHLIDFHRVILDEAHYIKDKTSSTFRSVKNLKTKKRWCLTGTPLQNRVGELYTLIIFMKINPFNLYFCTKCDCSSETWKFLNSKSCEICGHTPMLHTNFFNHFLLKNIQKHGVEDEGLRSFQNLRLLLEKIMLRRTKIEKADDLGLPPKIVVIRKDKFNSEEKDLYKSLYSDSKRQFDDYVSKGVILNNYANIFTLITRMRQMADHPDLVLKKSDFTSSSNHNNAALICFLCNEEAQDPIETKCHHIFCRLCINEYVSSFSGNKNALKCSVCHIGLSIDLKQPTYEFDSDQIKKLSIINKIKFGSHSGNWKSSTKIEALLEELYRLKSDRITIKSIVFSQFTSMLDLIDWRLKKAGFNTVRLQGSMTPQQRDSTINYFMDNINSEVFLISLKAGGIALNLCEASHVFIMDPWWNPSVEWQSMDRVHRIGQRRPIKITRFCIEDSIELKIIELQEKKANMINATVNFDDAAISRLSPDDLQFLFLN